VNVRCCLILTGSDVFLSKENTITFDCITNNVLCMLKVIEKLKHVDIKYHFHPNKLFCWRDLLFVGLSTDILHVEIFKLKAELIKF